jgi:hypothetical protein
MELNACRGSGTYGCDPAAILAVLHARLAISVRVAGDPFRYSGWCLEGRW